MKSIELINFYQLQHRIFGVCPYSRKIFRLSECHIHTENKPEHDWLRKLEDRQIRLDNVLLHFQEHESKELNILGRRQANRTIKKFDNVFRPRKLDPDDSVGIFHPIDYVVFDGIKKDNLRRIVFLDRDKKIGMDKGIKDSIDKVINKKPNYDWLTLRIDDDGKITEE